MDKRGQMRMRTTRDVEGRRRTTRDNEGQRGWEQDEHWIFNSIKTDRFEPFRIRRAVTFDFNFERIRN